MHLNGHQRVVHVCVCLVGVDVGGEGRESSLSNLTRLENDLQSMGAITWKSARQTRAECVFYKFTVQLYRSALNYFATSVSVKTRDNCTEKT